jgi:hypothetical protein
MRQTLWKGKKNAKPIVIHKAKYPLSLEWNGEEQTLPKIVQKLSILETEVAKFLESVTGLSWVHRSLEQRLTKTIIYGDEVAKAIYDSGISRYMEMRQWVATKKPEAILIDTNPIGYYDLKMRVFKALEIFLEEYRETKK